MLLLALLSNVSLSLALVPSRACLPPPRLAAPTMRRRPGAKPSHELSSSHPWARDHQSSNTPVSHPKGTALSSAAAAASSAAPAPANKRQTALATALLLLLDARLRSLFARCAIPFPSSLAGCGALFSGMLALDAANEARWGERVYAALNPGATLLAKWLPVFFVPSLITLPLASGLGDALEVRPRVPQGSTELCIFLDGAAVGKTSLCAGDGKIMHWYLRS